MKSNSKVTLGYRVEEEGEFKKDSPVEIDRELLKDGHMHIRGRTRSGKSALAITPLVLQLLKPYDVLNDQGQQIAQNVRDSVFIFDLGGDLGLFNLVKQECLGSDKVAERQFRFFSLDPRDNCQYFDPFQMIAAGEDRVIRICNMLVEAFHLDFGLIYGGSYYTQRNLAALLRVANELVKKYRTESGGAQFGVADIVAYLENLHERDVRDAEQVKMTLRFLTEYDRLANAPDDTENEIIMERAIRDGEVNYFLCPTMGEATTARQIVGLGLMNVINAAMQRVRKRAKEKDTRGSEPVVYPHIWIIADEFQEVAGRSFAQLLAQLGKFGASIIMANQTTTQLETRDIDLARIVADNTIVKQYFTVTSKKDIEELQSLSRETSGYLHRIAENLDILKGRVAQEFLEPRLKKDTILEVSGTSKQSFLLLDDGSGHNEPLRIYSKYVCNEETYRRHKVTPPESREGDVSGLGRATVKDKEIAPWRNAKGGEFEKREEQLGAKLEEKRKLEEGE